MNKFMMFLVLALSACTSITYVGDECYRLELDTITGEEKWTRVDDSLCMDNPDFHPRR